MPLAGLIAPVVGGLISAFTGHNQKKEAKDELSRLSYPEEDVPQEFVQGQSIAEELAATGMPSEQYNQAMRNIQRQQLTALRYANDRRGGFAVLPQILQGTNDATLSLDAKDAEQRLAAKRNLISYKTMIGGQKRDLFDKNIRDKYNRDYNYSMGKLGVGNTNFVSGLDKILAGGLAAWDSSVSKKKSEATAGGL